MKKGLKRKERNMQKIYILYYINLIKKILIKFSRAKRLVVEKMKGVRVIQKEKKRVSCVLSKNTHIHLYVCVCAFLHFLNKVKMGPRNYENKIHLCKTLKLTCLIYTRHRERHIKTLK